MAYYNEKKVITNVLTAYLNEDEVIAQVSRPNLLINSNFEINQRGKSSYTNNGYTVDRWYLTNTNGSAAPITNGGITLTASSGNIYFQQKIENGFDTLKGKVVTLSLSINNNVVYVSGTVPTTITSGTQSIGSISYSGLTATSLYLNASGVLFVQIGITNGNTINVDYAKLEIGDKPTLYTPPIIAEELPKCQRYYEVSNGQAITKWARTTNHFYEGTVSFKVTKRTAPTIFIYSNSDNTSGALYNTNTGTNVTTANAMYINTYGFQVYTTNNDLTANNRYTGYFTADAEIY